MLMTLAVPQPVYGSICGNLVSPGFEVSRVVETAQSSDDITPALLGDIPSGLLVRREIACVLPEPGVPSPYEFFHGYTAAGLGVHDQQLILNVCDFIRHYLLRRTNHGYGSFFLLECPKKKYFSYVYNTPRI
jgi:hypothetical protein